MIRVGVIGYGYWGPNIVRNFSNQKNCTVAALVDFDDEKLAAAARMFPGLKTYNSPSAMLADGVVDAVAIATPMATHYSLAREALLAGKHCLIEKPMTATSEEAEDLIRLADERGLTLMVDHTFIFSGAVQKLREVIDAGELGEIYYYDSVRVNLGLFQHDLSVLWDLAPHDFSIMNYLIDKEPTRVTAVGGNPLKSHGYQLESLAYIAVEFGDGSLAHFHVNWMSPAKVRRTLIGGSKKMAMWDDLEPDQQVKIVDKGIDIHAEEDEERYRTLIQYRTGDMWVPKIDQTEALHKVAHHFLECIESGATPLTDGRSGLRVVRLLEAAQRSIEEHAATQERAHTAVSL